MRVFTCEIVQRSDGLFSGGFIKNSIQKFEIFLMRENKFFLIGKLWKGVLTWYFVIISSVDRDQMDSFKSYFD